MSFQVDTEKLAGTSVTVSGHGEDLALNHTTTDTRFTTAQSGWLGRSAASLSNRLDKWATASTLLLTHIGANATAMQNGVIAYTENEQRSAQAMDQLNPQPQARPGSVDV